jgi:hypothetical protein
VNGFLLNGFFLNAADRQLSPYIGQYDPMWVGASVLIALVSSICAMEMSRRLSDVASRRLWLPFIALVMGAGIWSMHFVGMLAFRLDCGVDYSPWVTGLSMLPGMAAAMVALNDQGRQQRTRTASSFVVSALILGAGIGVMHYAGMAAMVFDGTVRYEPVLLICSLLLAVLFAFVALRLNHALSQRRTLKHPLVASLASGTTLALAITAMHYSAMEAAYFLPLAPGSSNLAQLNASTTPSDTLAAWVVWIALGLMLVCLLLTYISTRFAAARQRIDAILAATTQSFVQLDAKGCITDCNAAMVQLWGQPREALIGQNLAHLFKDMQAPFQAGATEAVLMRPELGRLPCLVTFNEVRNDNGHVLYAFAWLTDLSAHWRAEELLTLAKQQAEAAARMKSDFLSNMSHEIRTPMNAIMGMTHLVQKTELNPKQRDYLQKIEGASQHLLGIINDILDISKIEAGKMAIEQVAFSLDSLLARVTDLVGDKARDKGLRLEVTIDPDVPRQLRGDVLRLSQILLNYANNAVKFTPAGLVHIRVAVHGDTEQSLPSLPPGSPITLKFSVRDTGIGLSQEAMDYLFQSFVQADASTTRRYGGTGLGLAISKQLARLMHGDVGVHSSPGQGATFWFTAQLLVADLRELAHGGQTISPTLEGPNMAAPRTGLRVLLAEDNPINQQVAQEMLEALGAVVTVVGDGAQALETLSQPHAFDLVLMDMQMPVMDGLEATRRLRAMPGLCTLPVLAMTANAMQSAIDQCLQAGMNDHLAKPVNPEALSRALTRWTSAGVGVEVGADLEREGAMQDARIQNADQVLQATQTTDVQRALERLTRVEGLDTAQGLRSVLRPALYIDLLRQFSRAEQDFGQRCAQALGVGVGHVDGEQALRLAHTLKGVAATLGAHQVATQAAQLETLLHTLATNHPEVQAAAQSLQSTLGTLLQAVDEVLSHSSEEPHTKTPAAPTSDVRDIVRRMAALARESDATALELMQEHRANLEKTWPQATRHAAELLQNYDFPEAALVLEAALTGSA